jgi:bifunctional UDP-N-acetylglucosamine pyrophosphorylase/glucosamine-1-phosphate N-acetyltransferase
MKSERPKVAHELLGKPLVRWVIDAAQAAGSTRTLTVVGHQREQVIPLVDDTTIVVQEERLGTGHAVMVARAALEKTGATPAVTAPPAATAPPAPAPAAAVPAAQSLVVLNGDTPLITAATIAELVALQQDRGAAACVLSCELDDPSNYGRIIRDEAGEVLGIVEEKDATPAQRAITEVNSGAYCFDLAELLGSLNTLSNKNAQNEYYLTDVLGILVGAGKQVCAHCIEDADELMGINSRAQLAQATKAMQRHINERHMAAGVTMLDPDLVWIGADVTLQNDIELLPMTILYGQTSVGSGSVLGPNTRVIDSTVGRDCVIDESVVLGAVLHDKVSVGPRAYLRLGTLMKTGSKAGTHVEIKNSTIGENSKVPHLSYMGDATLGVDVNIGAGSITCNYDGTAKNPTLIGDRSFVGSDTMFVAPVQLGADVVTGAGSVITKDVPAGALAIERSSQRTVADWVAQHSKRDKEKPQLD